MTPKTDSFIHEIPLKTTPSDGATLNVRLDAARNLYNAILSESFRRLDRMRQSKTYQSARKLPKSKPRGRAFRASRSQYGFEEYSLHTFAARTCAACWIGDHLDAFTIQKVATRAFGAVEQYAYNKKGRPRFKRKGWFTSIEGKSNASGIRWRGDHILWKGLNLKPLFDLKDRHGVQAHALSCRVKYVRLLKRTIKGEERWFVQLVLEGKPLLKAKNTLSATVCGLDIGPSTIAGVGEDHAFLAQFCPGVIQPWKEIRRCQRAQDRSRRATNPGNYNQDGTVKQGSRRWNNSNRYRKRQQRIAECHRTLAATRKREHGEMVNTILSMGTVVRTEKISYKSFQKNFGRSVTVRGPGMLVDLLIRKAANAGGRVEEISTWKTKLSQACICGAVVKKPLKQRHHLCECGASSQRDLFSAFLAKHCTNDTLDIHRAKSAWSAAEPLLRRAMSRLTQTASRGLLPTSFGIPRRQSCSPVENGSPPIEVADGVACKGESREKVPGPAVRTPWL